MAAVGGDQRGGTKLLVTLGLTVVAAAIVFGFGLRVHKTATVARSGGPVIAAGTSTTVVPVVPTTAVVGEVRAADPAPAAPATAPTPRSSAPAPVPSSPGTSPPATAPAATAPPVTAPPHCSLDHGDATARYAVRFDLHGNVRNTAYFDTLRDDAGHVTTSTARQVTDVDGNSVFFVNAPNQPKGSQFSVSVEFSSPSAPPLCMTTVTISGP